MKQARRCANQRLVKELTLRYKTIEGRESTASRSPRTPHAATASRSSCSIGVHHAREWPSGEHSIEFAYDLLTDYATSDAHDRPVDTTRTIVVPIVNPDGFNLSREAPALG